MFDVWCSGCARRVLLWASNLEALQPGPAGMAIFYRFQCGEPGIETLPRARVSGLPSAGDRRAVHDASPVPPVRSGRAERSPRMPP